MAIDSSTEDEGEDNIIQEIDICLAKSLAEKLFLLQYPVRPVTMTYDHVAHLETRMKPIQQKIELELGMDISSSTYCFSRGEQIAHAVDRCDQGDQKPFFPGQMMDRHVLSSVRATEDSSKYAAAVYSDGVLHITPVKGVVQLRPGFSYFDKAEENQKKAAAALIAAEQDSQDEEELNEAKPVQMRFAKTPLAGKKSKKLSYYAEMKQQAEEDWINMQFFQPHDHRSTMERNLLYCHQDDFESPEFTVTSRDYLKILAPQEEQDARSPADLPHGVLSLLKLKTMNFTDQIKALLITAKVLQFTQLCTLLGGGLDEKVVLKGLDQYALLVQGCWVVKSEILYPKGSKSQVSGLDGEKLWSSRDYVMFCFNRKRILSRKDIASASRLPTEELREVLEQIARQRPAQGWEFMLNTDIDFLYRHSETCLQQAALWKQKYKTIAEHLHLTDEFSNSEWKETDFPGLFPQAHRKPGTPRRQRSKYSISEDSPEKTKQKGRRRSKSQTIPDEQLTTKVKEEHISPAKQETNIKTSPGLNLHGNKKILKNSKAVRNITDILVDKESASDSDKINRKRKIKASLKIDSDSDDAEDSKQDLKPVIEKNEDQQDIIMSDCEKFGNEVVVKDVIMDQRDTSENFNTEEIFVPPVASRGKVEFDEKEKPPSDIFMKELKKFCREAIRSGALSLAEIKEVLTLRQQEPGNILCTGVNDDLLVKCINDTGAVEPPIKWGYHSIPVDRRRIFLYRQLNESTDKFRCVVIDMFERSLSLRRKDIFERFASVLGEQPSNHSYSKLMAEFCENHNGQWYLNGTFQSVQKYS